MFSLVTEFTHRSTELDNAVAFAGLSAAAKVRYVDASAVSSHVDLTTVDRAGGGAARVDPRRTESRGYTRQLLTYERAAQPLRLTVSAGSTELDTLLHPGGGVPLRECLLTNDDCDRGARTSATVQLKCTHLRDDVLDATNSTVLIPRNRDRGGGWCLPTRLHTLSNRRQCNPMTGNWILTAIDGLSSDNVRSGGLVQLVCKCRYPNLMTQTSPEGDCDQPVGCRGGRLDDLSVAGLVDPYVSGRCLCDSADSYSSFDLTVGPVCARKKINESSGELRRFVAGSEADVPSLPFELISPQFLEIWRSGGGGGGANGDQDLRLPDPCRLDTRTGRVIADVARSCRAVFDAELRAAVCKASPTLDLTNSSTVATTYAPIRTSTDYLFNNHGRHDNACISMPAVEAAGAATGRTDDARATSPARRSPPPAPPV